MQINLSNKNKTVFQLVTIMQSEKKVVLFTGSAVVRKEAFIKELRTHFPNRVTLKATSIPSALPGTVRLIIVESVSNVETLNQWLKMHSEGFPNELDSNKKVYPKIVIVLPISKKELNAFRLEQMNNVVTIDLN